MFLYIKAPTPKNILLWNKKLKMYVLIQTSNNLKYDKDKNCKNLTFEKYCLTTQNYEQKNC